MSERTPHDDAGAEPGTRSAEAAVAETVSELPGGPRKEAVIGRGIAWSATWSARWILIAIALVILGEVVGKTWSILMPVALALLVTAVLAPIAGFFERHAKFPPALAAAATLIGGVGLVTYGIFLMAPSVASQSTEIADDAVKGIDELQKWVRDSNLFNKEQIDDFLAAAQDRLQKSAGVIAGGVLTGVSALTSAVINMVVVAFLVFFFLKDGRHFRPWLRKVTGPGVGEHIMEVSGRAWDTLGGFIRTQAMVSGIDAVFIGGGLLLIGVPLAIPLAVLTFFGGFVPIVGAITAGAIAVLVALVSNGLTGALWVLLLIVAVQQLEGNVLSPMLQSKSMNLHPAVVLLSVTLGSSLFGIAGAFLAVPSTAVVAVFFRYLLEQVDRTVALGGNTPPPRPDEEDEETHVPLAGVAHKVGSMVTAVRSRRAARRDGSGGGDGA